MNHNKLIDVLRKYEIPSEEIRIISSIYWNQVAYVRTNKGMSKQISIKKGVRQGCILSPVLFNLYSEELINEALEDEEGVKLNGIGITNIRYADDTILIADSEDKLQRMLNKVVDACSNFGMELNVKKTKVMVIEKMPSSIIEVKVNNNNLEQLQNYMYLGAYISSDRW